MLFYETYGNTRLENEPPLVFLHGFLGSRLDWLPVIETLKNRYRCILIDLSAHGKSPFSLSAFALLEKTISKISRNPPILVGYSLGGRLCLTYAQKHTKRVLSVIALSTHTGLQTSLEKKKRKAHDLLWQKRLDTLSSEDFLSLWYQQPVFSSLQNNPILLKQLLLTRKYNNPMELSSILEQFSLANQPCYKLFAQPTYFLFGSEDVRYKNLYERYPSSMKKEIPNAGHTIHLESSFLCAEAIDFYCLDLLQNRSRQKYTHSI